MISYSALTSYGKATLPSVEGWNGNSDIIRDPPSGIHTRRIIKVGENNDLLDWNEDSGSRVSEMINIYARGNNPMVSVQYSNHGNTGSGLMGRNGGTSGSTMSGVMTSGGGGKLPYRIMNEGAFRPPILRQEDLLPLSRMPRLCTSITSKRCRVDQTKRIEPDVVEYFKEIHKAPMRVSAQSQRSFKKEGPTEPPSNINLMINSNLISNSVNTDVRKTKDGGDHSVPILGDAFLTSNVDHINQKRISRQKYLSTDIKLDKNVPNYEAQTTSNLNIQRSKNNYILGGQTVKLTKNIPQRNVSRCGAHTGGTMVKIGQDKMISGVTLKTRGIH
ncbi:hypothetical protein WIV_gp087 [Wiseana iridescent virus]|uniref:Uncharacterized protein n=1 Tax=Wiseana iridescent virus TaxID=68347 RepID=G0T5B3_IRV9|nr:hypothetical protein WIV_gp087 [Wiseana iridescent virus]ADO00430.1 hypothetical protein [Wiseana iridescent virus]